MNDAYVQVVITPFLDEKRTVFYNLSVFDSISDTSTKVGTYESAINALTALTLPIPKEWYHRYLQTLLLGQEVSFRLNHSISGLEFVG